METRLDIILDNALRLPPALRACLAERLIESLGMEEGMPLSSAWRDEIERRVKEVEENAVAMIPAEEVFAAGHNAESNR
jgi:putative addiction module component (TIGR02574 family)